MLNRWMKISVLSAFLILGLFLVFIPTFVSASLQPDDPLPTAIPPETYPNSNTYPAVVYLATQDDLQILYRLVIDFEGLRYVDGAPPTSGAAFRPSIATVYINPDQAQTLSRAGLSPIPIPNEGYRSFLAYGPGSNAPDAWPTFDQFVARMQALETAHSDIVDLVSIGNSVLGKPLYCMEITDFPGVDEGEPEFKYTANHHGDETTGVEMTMRLAELLASNYGIDPVMTDMVDKMEIWLCPIYNPDGYIAGTRYNAHNKDLNRDFPDRFTDPIDDPTGREPETQAYMYFGYDHRFVMGANYHGGAQVLNYPWDAVSGPPYNAPDDQLFFDFGLGYTSRNSYLWNGGWPYGMTRGWEWYMIYGGMQDWAYNYRGEHHVTLEISNTKSPAYNQMDLYWNQNRDAMLWWIQRVWTGLSGQVLDARDNTPLDATVTLVGRDIPNTIHTDPEVGDYHRVISAGDYTLDASADGYQSEISNVTVISGTLSSRDFYLCPEDPWIVSGYVTDAVTGIPLQATIEFIGSHQVVNSDPVTGDYSIEICPASYTMHVSALWHYSEERIVTVDHSQTQDYALLPTPNLSPSEKSASASMPLPMDVVHYQLLVKNAGITATISITDTLPMSITWTGELTATQGIPFFDAGQILWQGELSPSQPVTITYAVSLNQCLPADSAVLNIAEFDDGVNGIVTSKVQLDVANAVPTLPGSPSPLDGAVSQPITTSLSWAASTDLNCDPITYDLAFGTSPTPPIVETDLSATNYDPGALLPGTTYYWYVIAHDGLTQTPGPTWTFSTSPLITFLPLTIK
ncbi:MAG: hypothetical protein A2032_02605 [Chloroflexi bacterium RBG_19FT_COMBO_49_13]|nr:MAG: hypothetical protein A2032_02605 [Chloroflexi bacterium RBG_19FT_COMBO_49_13]